MLKATIKSLLGRKLRLLMSTFAIVLGVAFVGGSLIFSDTLGRSFTALFASTVGDVVVRPADAGAGLGASTVTIPASVVDDLESVPGAARVDGNVTAFGVYVVDKDNKVVGGQGPPAIGGNYSDAPAGHGLPGLALTEGRPPSGPDEVVFDAKTAQRSGYFIGEKVHIVTSSDQALLTPKLVGILDFPEGGSLNGATFAAFDTPTAQDLFLEGEDAYTDIWVTADDGVSPDRAEGRGQRTAARRHRGRHRRHRRRRGGLRPARGDQLPADVPADLRRHLPGRRRVPDRQHVLDPGRPAQPRARPAACPRCVEATGDPLGAVRGVPGRRRGLHARARPRRAAGDGHPGALRELRSRPHRSGADLRPADRAGLLRRRRPRHDGGRVAPGPPDDPDRARAGAARRHRAARDLDPPPAAARAGGHRGGGRRDGRGAVHRRPARRLGARPGDPRRAARGDGGQPGDQPAVPRGRPGDVPPACSAPSGTSPARTPCATRAGRPRPRPR